MSHRKLIMLLTLVVLTCGSALTRRALQSAADKGQGARGRQFMFGPFAKPPVDLSSTSRELPP